VEYLTVTRYSYQPRFTVEVMGVVLEGT